MLFTRIAGELPGGAEQLFRLHPADLTALLELVWETRSHENTETGRPNRRSIQPELPKELLDLFGRDNVNGNTHIARNRALFTPAGTQGNGTNLWDHLIYALMIENTGIYEIFTKVLYEFLHGEKIGVPRVNSQLWLRNTEELFYKNPPHFFITNITSQIRPDMHASRKNAYYRMFGMININSDSEHKFHRPENSNTKFVAIFEDFCRSVWEGIINFGNSSGANPTDDSSIANTAQQLHNMLMARRQYGNLSREEFLFIAMMSWLHLSITFNSSIVEDLRAEASSPEQRLMKVGERVNIPAHANSKSFFDLSITMSRILLQIEAGTYNDPTAVPALYTKGSGPEIDMRTIITHWSLTTGTNLRARTSPVSVQA